MGAQTIATVRWKFVQVAGRMSRMRTDGVEPMGRGGGDGGLSRHSPALRSTPRGDLTRSPPANAQNSEAGRRVCLPAADSDVGLTDRSDQRLVAFLAGAVRSVG